MGNVQTKEGTTRIAPLLTVSDVCQILGVSRQTVYRLVHGGELVPVRVRSHARFAPGDIQEFIERKREGAA